MTTGTTLDDFTDRYASRVRGMRSQLHTRNFGTWCPSTPGDSTRGTAECALESWTLPTAQTSICLPRMMQTVPAAPRVRRRLA